jgi:hypothetical protein
LLEDCSTTLSALDLRFLLMAIAVVGNEKDCAMPESYLNWKVVADISLGAIVSLADAYIIL